MNRECTGYAFKKQVAHLLLVVRTCSIVSRICRGRPTPGCLHACWIPTGSERGIRGHGPQGRASPFSTQVYVYVLHLLLQSQESRQITYLWTDTIHVFEIQNKNLIQYIASLMWFATHLLYTQIVWLDQLSSLCLFWWRFSNCSVSPFCEPMYPPPHNALVYCTV